MNDIDELGKKHEVKHLMAARAAYVLSVCRQREVLAKRKRYRNMKILLSTIAAVVLLTSAGATLAKEVKTLPGKPVVTKATDDYVLMQSTTSDAYGVCYGYICGRWGCYKYEVPCQQ